MGRNTGNGTRIGVTGGRKQTYNPRTKKYIKINTETGKFMSSSNTKYKNIRMVKKTLQNKLKNLPKENKI